MSRPALEVADMVRLYGAAFLNAYEASLSLLQKAVLRALLLGRTAALGGHLEPCDHPACGYQRPAYHSCRNRHCPKCQSLAKARWIQARQQQLRPVVYFHVVFTLPQSIAALALQHKKVVDNLLFQTVAATLRSIAADPKHLGAEIGFFAVLHPWGQHLLHHPHLHGVVPGGGRSPDGQRWIPCRCPRKSGKPFFLSVKVLSARFRRLFRAALVEACQQGQLSFYGDLATLAEPAAFERWLRAACRQKWVVYAKRPFGGPAQVIEYLGRYTPRLALSNHRLRTLKNGYVAFSWKDYRHGGVEKVLSLEALELLRRFWLHVLPRGFVRIRHFGLLATRHVQDKIAACRPLLHVDPATLLLPTPPSEWDSLYQQLTGKSLDQCPLCPHGHMVWHALPVTELSLFNRSPPASSLAAGVSCTEARELSCLHPELRRTMSQPRFPDSCRLPETERRLPNPVPPRRFHHATPAWESSLAHPLNIETP
jgi:Putative transposase/Transposase zinc-binding domain